MGDLGLQRRIQPIDLILILAYLAGTTLLGVWFRKGQKDIQTYFVGGREIPWWLVLVSIVATETSTVTFLSVPGLAFNPSGGSLVFLQLALGYIVGRLVVAFVLLPGYFQGEYLSAYEVLKKRFDHRVQRLASSIFLLTRTVADGLRLFLTALLLQLFTGWDMATSILAMGAITIFYTWMGGMQAVLWTDCIQFFIYTAGALGAGVILIGLIPGGWEGFLAAGNAAGKFNWIDLSANPALPFTLWAGVLGGAFFSMASHGADQIMVQRYLCSKNINHARVALISSGVVVFLQFLLFLLIGAGLFVLSHSGAWQLPEGIPNDQVFGRFIVEKLPVGMVGVVIAAVLAAAMSTLSSSLNSSASAGLADFYKPLRPGLPDEKYLRVSEWLTIFFGLAQVGVALAAWLINSPQGIINQVLSVAGLTTGMILGLFLLGTLRKPVSSTAALLGVFIGFAAVMAVFIPASFGHTIVAWPWYAPIGALTTFFAALAFNFFMVPQQAPK